MAEEQTERFTIWGNRITGIIGLAIVAAFVVVGLAERYHPAVFPVCGLVALLLWTVLLRPAASVKGDRLVLRNPLATVHLPLAAIEHVAVRQWLAVRVGERRYTNSAVGRSRRQGLRDDKPGADVTDMSYGGFVERRIRKLAEEERARQHVRISSEEQEALAADVRREPAWVEIGLAVLLGLALVVTLVV